MLDRDQYIEIEENVLRDKREIIVELSNEDIVFATEALNKLDLNAIHLESLRSLADFCLGQDTSMWEPLDLYLMDNGILVLSHTEKVARTQAFHDYDKFHHAEIRFYTPHTVHFEAFMSRDIRHPYRIIQGDHHVRGAGDHALAQKSLDYFLSLG